MSPGLRRCALAAILVPLVPTLAFAQDRLNRPAMSLSGGVRLNDRADHDAHAAVSVAIRSELPIAEIFVLELAGSVADVPEGHRNGIGSLFESQLQLAIPLGDVLTPYAGAGAGIAKIEGLGTEAAEWQALFTAAVGVRVSLSSNLGMVADARIRGRGSHLAGHMDMTVGCATPSGARTAPASAAGADGSRWHVRTPCTRAGSRSREPARRHSMVSAVVGRRQPLPRTLCYGDHTRSGKHLSF